MSRKSVIGIMGAGEDARPSDVVLAERLGELVAREGYVVLTGGRDAGVMAAASRGAKRVGGSITVGVLPSSGKDGDASPFVDVVIYTGMGNARNAINVLSSDVVVACGAFGPGTASEAALALKSGRALVLLSPTPEARAFFTSLGGVEVTDTAEQALEVAKRIVTDGKSDRRRSNMS